MGVNLKFCARFLLLTRSTDGLSQSNAQSETAWCCW